MKIAVLGGGHGCYAAAADLSEAGHEVRLWRRDAAALQPVQHGGIRIKDQKDPRAVRIFCSIAVLTVDVLIRIVHDLQKRDASQRIASVLHRAAWIGDVPIPLSQSEIGIMANASRRQVSAAMNRFAEAGWIEHTYRSITVSQPQALRDYAEQDEAD